VGNALGQFLNDVVGAVGLDAKFWFRDGTAEATVGQLFPFADRIDNDCITQSTFNGRPAPTDFREL
jgi:hypothetical protein